jgi:HTH-type transcriptional regulator / antitoxin HigA
MTRRVIQPDYASPPGETLQETIEAIGMSQVELALRMGRPLKTVNEIIQGKSAITSETALQLEFVLGIDAAFWSSLEANYRDCLERLEWSRELELRKEWAQQFPYNAMATYGWVGAAQDIPEHVESLLRFFGVASIEAWNKLWLAPAAVFRKSSVFEASPATVAAWLRQGEIQAQEIRCQDFSASGFRHVLEDIKNLTKEPPAVFIPTLMAKCAACGVAVAFVRELPKCPISGATRWLSPTRALVQLSLRYKTDDQLWFSFFHEAGHILRHGKKKVFLERTESQIHQDLADLEEEANDFAEDTLIPKGALKSFLRQGSFTEASIVKFADSLSIAPGIVVGRLQHDGVIPFNVMGGMKRRFVWADR